MDYYRISFNKSESESDNEIFIAFLSDYGFESFEETDDKIAAYIPVNKFSEKEITNIPFDNKDIFLKSMKKEVIAEQNWNAVWESNYPPVVIENKIYIYAPFHEKKPEYEYQILIKPKMSFGTAHHETTALMMTLMLEEDFTEKNILDMGSGTAVLAILASMKNANHIDAIDNDTWAYNNAVENIELNGIKNITPLLGDSSLLTTPDNYDMVLANINKNILLNDIPHYARSLKKGGAIFFSGFYDTDLDDIKNKAGQFELSYDKHIEKNRWIAARFIKK